MRLFWILKGNLRRQEHDFYMVPPPPPQEVLIWLWSELWMICFSLHLALNGNFLPECKTRSVCRQGPAGSCRRPDAASVLSVETGDIWSWVCKTDLAKHTQDAFQRAGRWRCWFSFKAAEAKLVLKSLQSWHIRLAGNDWCHKGRIMASWF